MEPMLIHVAKKASALLRDNLQPKRYASLYVQPNELYCDSMIRGHRRGSGFLHLGAPSAAARFDYLQLNITFRPGVIDDAWVGYSVIIRSPESQPVAQNVACWPEAGGQKDIEPATIIGTLLPHLVALLDLPTALVQPPREAPDAMY